MPKHSLSLPLLFLSLVLFSCTSTTGHNQVPAERELMGAASQNGKRRATLERYDPKTRIAMIRTPGWQPESKPYQFDGKAWIPLWSPFSPEEEYTKETSP